MIRLIVILLLIVLGNHSCNQPSPLPIAAPPGYDFKAPQVIKLPAVLNEISGIAFNNGRPDTIYAEQDEEGRLFYFLSGKTDIKHHKFGKNGDYEDLAIINGNGIVLRSDGALFSFPLNIAVKHNIIDVTETAGLLPPGEYEGMYADNATNQLYILCKECKVDQQSKNTTGYIVQLLPGNQFSLKGNFQLNSKEIAALIGKNKLTFRPSALAKNPRTNQWYILSSVNKLLVIADSQWITREVYALNPSLFAQPEGIAFDRDNNLYISNERGGAGAATVLKFTFVKNQ